MTGDCIPRERGEGEGEANADLPEGLPPRSRARPTIMVITFAHRGARLEEPENTIAAFERALRAGVTGLETDVWLSADGEVVCAHDPVVRSGRLQNEVSPGRAVRAAVEK